MTTGRGGGSSHRVRSASPGGGSRRDRYRRVEGLARRGAAGVAYTISKHAVIGLVKSTAYFYGPQGIRSNAVLPGPVETNIGATASPRVPWVMERSQLSMATMGPAAQPNEIAAAISWLASDEASNVNGATLAVDGGWSTA